MVGTVRVGGEREEGERGEKGRVQTPPPSSRIIITLASHLVPHASITVSTVPRPLHALHPNHICLCSYVTLVTHISVTLLILTRPPHILIKYKYGFSSVSHLTRLCIFCSMTLCIIHYSLFQLISSSPYTIKPIHVCIYTYIEYIHTNISLKLSHSRVLT